MTCADSSSDLTGDLLLAIVERARERGFDAETAVRGAARRRVAEIRGVEGLA